MKWKGSVFPRGSKLYLKIKDARGDWKQVATSFRVGEEAKANRLLSMTRDQVAAGASVVDSTGVVTVESYSRTWLKNRERERLDWKTDRSRLDNHINPALGRMALEEVRPRDLFEMVRKLREGDAAPRSIRNIYGVVAALFRDAALDGLIEPRENPCILNVRQLGAVVDKDSSWRETAIYTRAEVLQLVDDERVPLDRRVLYAILFFGGVRHGEAAGLRWDKYDETTESLGRLSVVTSYARGRTKANRARAVPVHPVLAGILKEWKEQGWEATMGRAPTGEDLVSPTPGTGNMRTKGNTYRRLQFDLKQLGLRQRRVHDLRRTFISLARSDGARKDLLKWATHAPPRDVMELYTSFEWQALCDEVRKLKFDLRRAVVLPLTAALAQRNLGATLVQCSSSAENDNIFRVSRLGIEPRTLGLKGRCSTS